MTPIVMPRQFPLDWLDFFIAPPHAEHFGPSFGTKKPPLGCAARIQSEVIQSPRRRESHGRMHGGPAGWPASIVSRNQVSQGLRPSTLKIFQQDSDSPSPNNQSPSTTKPEVWRVPAWYLAELGAANRDLVVEIEAGANARFRHESSEIPGRPPA